MRKDFTFAMVGGLDEVTPAIALPPGRAIASLNHEPLDTGYGRIQGYERFDGRTSPTDFPFYVMAFTDGAGAITAGQTITGATSGATGVVLVDVTLDSGAWDGTGAGYIGFRTLTGHFVTGEDIQVAAVTKAQAAGAEIIGVASSGNDLEETFSIAASTYARALIQAVPGEGPVRGVWDFDGSVYAFRDNVGATAGRMYKATTGGWSLVDLGKKLAFTSGGTTEIAIGDTITGAISAATAVVRKVVVTSGTWSGGDAAGYFTVSGVTGTFQAENLDVGLSLNLASIAAAPTNYALPAGGRYFFITHNFFGATGTRAMYGVNGVGKGFEFDGTTFTEISTGMPTDTPKRVAEFRGYLFFAYTGGSVQHSSAADPFDWSAIVGTAAEIGIGSEVTDFVATIDTLLILGENGSRVLQGTGVSDWVLVRITGEAGAKPYTGQRIGPGIYLDNLGVRSVSATQAYGDFKMGSMSTFVSRTFDRYRAGDITAVASCIVRAKNHYRLFFDNGEGMTVYMGRKVPETMLFDLGRTVTTVCSNESALGERLFFGDEDGYVFQEKGISFDGEEIEAFIQLSYADCGSPNLLKRFFKVGLEVTAQSGTEIAIAAEYDYSGGDQSLPSLSSAMAQGTGGLWGIANWGQFNWSSPAENALSADIEGQGCNASVIIATTSASIAPYEVRVGKLYYGTRGQTR